MSGMKFEKEIFMKYLIEREASEATKKKYMTDVTTFYSYAAEAEEIDKELLLAYREWLVQHYAVSSVNSMLVALNQYLLAVGLGKWKLRRVRVQGEYYGAAEPPVRCGESHLSGLTEPPQFVY